MKILVVEDDKFYQNVYKAKLEKDGYSVELASDGEEALTKIKNDKPDLVLLDLIMPNKDGFETLKEIRENREWQDLNIIAVSNLGQEEDKKRAMSLGASGYFVKANLSIKQLSEIIKGALTSNLKN